MGAPLSTLAAATVRPATQQTYLNALMAFRSWLRVDRLDHEWAALMWDATLSEYIDWLYDQGHCKNMAEKTAASVRWAFPGIPRPMSRGLPVSIAAIRGWSKLEPGYSKPPLPRQLCVLIAHHLCLRGEHNMALLLMVMLETYLRPSEAMALRQFQLLPPVTGGRS